jgi:uncharacterized protein
MKSSRRKFLSNTLKVTFGSGIISGLYAWQIEPFWVEFVEQEMHLNHLPKNLVGKKLMQISDLHVSNRFDYKSLIESLNEAKKYNPDFVVLTGDFVTSYHDSILPKLEKVLDSLPKGDLGNIAILGNHDYGKNWSEIDVATKITSLLSKRNVTVLRNEKVTYSGIHFYGFDDLWGPFFDGEKTMKKYDSREASIALCHNPDACDLPIWGNYNSWILAGHTHGGQVKPPFLPPFTIPVKNKRYTSGKFELSNKRTLYINRALGNLWQIRFNVRPERTIFTLKESI